MKWVVTPFNNIISRYSHGKMEGMKRLWSPVLARVWIRHFLNTSLDPFHCLVL